MTKEDKTSHIFRIFFTAVVMNGEEYCTYKINRSMHYIIRCFIRKAGRYRATEGYNIDILDVFL